MSDLDKTVWETPHSLQPNLGKMGAEIRKSFSYITITWLSPRKCLSLALLRYLILSVA